MSLGLSGRVQDKNDKGQTLQEAIEYKDGRIMEEYCVNFVMHAVSAQEVILQCLIDDVVAEEGEPEK